MQGSQTQPDLWASIEKCATRQATLIFINDKMHQLNNS